MVTKKSPRANERHDVLKILRSAKLSITYFQGIWDVKSKIYESGTLSSRPRLTHEYPEMDPKEWNHLVMGLDDLIEGLTILREIANENSKRED